MESITINDYRTDTGAHYPSICMSYEVFGQPLHSDAPVVLVCHALTGNSTVMGESGWWNGIIGAGCVIDTDRYCVLAFNIPGNGYCGGELIENFRDFTNRDMAHLQMLGCHRLGIEHIHTAIGGSLGGSLVWEMAFLEPGYISTIIPVAADWKATDWMWAFNRIQMHMLEDNPKGMNHARMMAMMFYRTPQAFRRKFRRTMNDSLDMPNVESWLEHHGDKLEGRFNPLSYRLMVNLCGTIDVEAGRGAFPDIVKNLRCRVVQIAIDSDLFFVPYENVETHAILKKAGVDSHIRMIRSENGHDGFLIEFDQMQAILKEFFEKKSLFKRLFKKNIKQ